MMESPEPSKNNASSSASTVNAFINTPSSESPQVQFQESPFVRFMNTLSPIQQVKACHAAQSFQVINSPPLVFKSPRICHRETQFMERPQDTLSRRGLISQSENGGSSFGEAPGDSKKSSSQKPLSERFITDTLKVYDSKKDTNTQNCSPPPSIDEYLADPEDIDCLYSADPYGKQTTDVIESSSSDLTQSNLNILKFDRKDGPSDKAEEPFPYSEESNKVHQEKPVYVEEPEKMEGEKNDVEWATQERTQLESNLAADVSEKQYSHDSLPQFATNERWDHNDCTPQSMPDSLQDVKGSENYMSTSHVTAENISYDGSEASRKYHGIRRRCLQFEEATSNALGGKKSQVKLNATPSEMKMVHLSEPITSLFSQRGSGNLPVTGPKPSGIGLHLNSIINAVPTGRAATTGMRLSDGLQGVKSTSSISLHRVENMKRPIHLFNADGQTLVDVRNGSREIDAPVATDSLISQSPGMAEPIPLYPASTYDKRKHRHADAGNSEVLNQPSHDKKKKKTSITARENRCKRCNCKKSKCLKLYCDCFATGTYCTDPCACQGCLNRPEYAQTVSETRQQIESRNPIAFAPKIVQTTTGNSSNIMEDKNLTTPSSARHKRGCNCKRSMCQKKYCECYQANVGCSSGCRCEGCKNIYGKKEDYVALEHTQTKERMGSIKKGSDSTFHNRLEMVASRADYDLHHLSPITPSLQCSDQGKEASKSRLLSGNYLPSPEPDVNMFSSCSKYIESSENLNSSHALVEANEMLGTVTYDSQIDCNNVNIMDQSSPSCNSVSLLCQLTPLPHPESFSGGSPFTSRANEWTSIQPSRLSNGCIRQLSSSSLRWRGSPVTPRNKVCEAQYLQCTESDSGLYDILENETPDILKEASTPIKSVKVNSPTQKRVSPPQSHHRGIGSNSSGGLKNGRKFILKSLRSFPPLTPCVESKGKGKGHQDLGNDTSK